MREKKKVKSGNISRTLLSLILFTFLVTVNSSSSSSPDQEVVALTTSSYLDRVKSGFKGLSSQISEGVGNV